MNPFFFHYPVRGIRAFRPGPFHTNYDIERSLERRYRRREILLMWKSKLLEAWTIFLTWEHRLFQQSRPLAHAHVKPRVHRRLRRP